ncbi:MAG: hypothetical protein WCB92_10815 [Mycobacterium sp.]
MIGLIAVAALVVGIIALVRSGSNGGPTPPPPGPASPTFSPADAANAKKELCSTYEVAARSVSADSHGSDTALARISLINAAGMLDAAAANPALGASDRDAAHTLASAYRTTNAVSSVTDASSPLFQGTLDDAKRAADAMAAICR